MDQHRIAGLNSPAPIGVSHIDAGCTRTAAIDCAGAKTVVVIKVATARHHTIPPVAKHVSGSGTRTKLRRILAHAPQLGVILTVNLNRVQALRVRAEGMGKVEPYTLGLSSGYGHGPVQRALDGTTRRVEGCVSNRPNEANRLYGVARIAGTNRRGLIVWPHRQIGCIERHIVGGNVCRANLTVPGAGHTHPRERSNVGKERESAGVGETESVAEQRPTRNRAKAPGCVRVTHQARRRIGLEAGKRTPSGVEDVALIVRPERQDDVVLGSTVDRCEINTVPTQRNNRWAGGKRGCGGDLRGYCTQRVNKLQVQPCVGQGAAGGVIDHDASGIGPRGKGGAGNQIYPDIGQHLAGKGLEAVIWLCQSHCGRREYHPVVALRVVVRNNHQRRGEGFAVNVVLEGITRCKRTDRKCIAVEDLAREQAQLDPQRADIEHTGRGVARAEIERASYGTIVPPQAPCANSHITAIRITTTGSNGIGTILSACVVATAGGLRRSPPRCARIRRRLNAATDNHLLERPHAPGTTDGVVGNAD